MTLAELKDCPVCGQKPAIYPQRGGSETVECPWGGDCPEEGAFDFSYTSQSLDEAISAWNAAVDAYGGKK